MATYLENLTTARDNIAAKLAEVSANPKPSYTIDNQSVSWGDYMTQLQLALDSFNALIAAGQPYEIVTQAFTY